MTGRFTGATGKLLDNYSTKEQTDGDMISPSVVYTAGLLVFYSARTRG